MKLLVFGGSGKMGSSVAWDLVKQDDVEQVGLVDTSRTGLNRVQEWIGSSKIVLHELDLKDRAASVELMRTYDVGVVTLPNRKLSYRVAEYAIEAGLDLVDILEEYHRRPDAYEVEGIEIPAGMDLNTYGEDLHERLAAKGIKYLDGMGFAPGMSNLALGSGIDQLDSTEVAIARVGGIPDKPYAQRHPLKYMVTWAFSHVLREYMVRVNVIKDGEAVEVDALTDRENFQFKACGVDEALECAITPGMPSYLFTRPELKEFAEKTIRWPGHFSSIDTLKSCGLLDLEPVEVGGNQVVPRDVLLALIRPRLLPGEGETDVCIMWTSAEGHKDRRRVRIDSFLWDRADRKNGITSMARVTGFSAAIGALFLGRGLIPGEGIIAPEDGIRGDTYTAYCEELAKREIHIEERIQLL